MVGKERPGLIKTVDAVPRAVATIEEPTLAFIHQLARGTIKVRALWPDGFNGGPCHQLPHWDDLQIMAAQMATKPLMEDHPGRN